MQTLTGAGEGAGTTQRGAVGGIIPHLYALTPLYVLLTPWQVVLGALLLAGSR